MLSRECRISADRRTYVLVATGATSNVHRMLTAATAGGLALLGVALGLLAAYLGLLAAYRSHLGTLSHVPALYLLSVAVCAPGAAFLAGCSPVASQVALPEASWIDAKPVAQQR